MDDRHISISSDLGAGVTSTGIDNDPQEVYIQRDEPYGTTQIRLSLAEARKLCDALAQLTTRRNIADSLAPVAAPNARGATPMDDQCIETLEPDAAKAALALALPSLPTPYGRLEDVLDEADTRCYRRRMADGAAMWWIVSGARRLTWTFCEQGAIIDGYAVYDRVIAPI